MPGSITSAPDRMTSRDAVNICWRHAAGVERPCRGLAKNGDAGSFSISDAYRCRLCSTVAYLNPPSLMRAGSRGLARSVSPVPIRIAAPPISRADVNADLILSRMPWRFSSASIALISVVSKL